VVAWFVHFAIAVAGLVKVGIACAVAMIVCVVVGVAGKIIEKN